jgi:predicted HicB family RNase H-like nuclease
VTEALDTSFIILEHLERPGESRQKFAGQLNLRVEEV